jgi:hypothetical protein
MSAKTFVPGVVLLVCVAGLPAAFAAVYDNFDDESYCQDPNNPSLFDPNLWDIDNPHWTLYPLIGDYFDRDVIGGWLRLEVATAWFPFTFYGALADDGNHDANTSTTYFDNKEPHYIVARLKTNTPLQGGAFMVLHADPAAWTCYALDMEFDNNTYFSIDHLDGVNFKTAGSKTKTLDQTTGFWGAIQFDPTRNGTGDPNDPNNHFLRAACWNGGKFDWNAQWDIQVGIISRNLDPNTWTYWTEGVCGVAAYGSQYTGVPNSNVSFDNIEIRRGIWTNVSHTLKLTVNHSNWGSVEVDPNLVDPNDSTIQRYTSGTEVVLTATPVSGKSFKEWTVYDPNYPGDLSHAVSNPNTVLYLTMNADWEVGADFKCGSGLEPLLGIGLLAMVMVAVVRRIT